jgi:glutamine synthetase
MARQTALDSVLRRIKQDKINLIKFQWLGNDLIPRALVSHADYLPDHVRDGIGVAKALQSFNVLDMLAYGGSWGSEAKELRIVPDVSTFSPIPYAPGSGRFISELYDLNLKPHTTDARYFLRRVISKANEMGFLPMTSCEEEFYVLKHDGQAWTPYVHTKFATSYGYDLFNDYIQEVVANLTAMGVHLERLKKEYGHGQIEPSLRYTDALKAADDFVTLKDVAKGVAAKRGLFATFMPKPYQGIPGSGNHIHMSLFDRKTKRNVFFDAKDKRGCKMSKTGYYFIGGLLKHLNGTCIFGAPISNSYKRLLPGSWAPAHVCYGYDHRGAAIRIPSISPHSDGSAQRVENRVPDPSCNPYWAVGTTLAAGLDGIENEIEPGEPLKEEPAKLSDNELEKRGIEYLPRTVGEAIAEAKKDPFVKKTLGDVAFWEYVKVRESEWRDYREQVTPWETANYLTSI